MTRNEILSTLNFEQILELTFQMKEWAKDCQWADIDEDDVDGMTDEELLRGIEKHYSGGLPAFIKDGLI